MGVRNLWKILLPYGKKAQFVNKILAVDTSIWMHHYKNMPDDMVVFSVSKRIFKLLYNKIRPVFIFDGKPPLIKRETIERRKDEELKWLLRRIILNKKCMRCGKVLRYCSHINDLNGLELKRLNEEALIRLKHHKYNWGELSDEDSEFVECGSDDPNDYQSDYPNGNLRNDPARAEISIASFKQESIEGLTKQQQLKKLIELRAKRSRAMGFDNSTLSKFSTSQLENVRKRNVITSLIKNLNKNARKIIHSDWTAYSELKKDDAGIYRSFYCKEEDVKKDQEKDNELDGSGESEESDLEELFKKNQGGNWSDVFESYYPKMKETSHDPKMKETSKDDAENQLELNRSLLKTVGRQPQVNLPSTSYLHYQSGEDEEYEKTVVISEEKDKSEESDCSFNAFDQLDDSSHVDCTSEGHEESLTVKHLDVFGSDLQRIQRLIVELLEVFELPYVESIGETDPQCGYLFKKGLIDGVISEDNDMIIHGVTTYKNFFRKDIDILSFSYSDIASESGLDQNSLIKISYLLGSDYCLGVRGIGIKSVLEKKNSVTGADIAFLEEIYKDENVMKPDSFFFGSLDLAKLRRYAIIKGVSKARIDEVMVYGKKVVEHAV